MPDKIQWTEPKEITERRLQEETLPALRQTFRQCTRYLLMSGIPIAILCYFVNRQIMIFALPGLALMIYQIPLLIWLNIRQARKSGVKYWINSKGIQVNQRFFLWQDIEGYNFSDSALSPNFRNMNIKTYRSKAWRSLSFYRQDVDEHELQMMLERFASKAAQPAMAGDKQYALAELERRKQKALQFLYFLGGLSFLSGSGLAWSFREFLNVYSHNGRLFPEFMLMFPIFLILFPALLQRNRALQKEIEQTKSTESRPAELE